MRPVADTGTKVRMCEARQGLARGEFRQRRIAIMCRIARAASRHAAKPPHTVDGTSGLLFARRSCHLRAVLIRCPPPTADATALDASRETPFDFSLIGRDSDKHLMLASRAKKVLRDPSLL